MSSPFYLKQQMQRLLLICLMVMIQGCSNSPDLSNEQALQILIWKYNQIPEKYRHRDLNDILAHSPKSWKKDLEAEIREGEMRQTQDSLVQTVLEEPFFDQKLHAFTNAFHNPSIDTFFLQLENWGSLSLISEIYHLESNKIIYKKILRDPDCNFILGSETIAKECFTILVKKEKRISKEQYNDIRNFIQKIGFWGFPTSFQLSCMDGNYLSVFLKEKSNFKYAGVSCPPALHSIQHLMNQIIQLL